ncbi:MAG: CapA family protein [bacterium]|nr:CapA family protein [bacterium]
MTLKGGLLWIFCLFFLVAPLLAAPEKPVSAIPEAQALFKEATAALVKHRPDLALPLFKQALKLDPKNPKFYWEMGWAYWQQSDWERVLERWEWAQKYGFNGSELPRFRKLARQYLAWEQGAQKRQVDQPPLPASAPGELVLTAVGDMMLGSDYGPEPKLPPDEGKALFAEVRYLLDGDLVVGNLEAPITTVATSDKCSQLSKCYLFRTPLAFAARLKEAGFDLLNLANNHISDFGLQGMKDTMAALESAQLQHYGLRARPSADFKVGDIRITFIGASTTGCCQHMSDLEGLSEKVKKAKQTADLVVVTFHGGAEGLEAAHVPLGEELYLGEPRGDVRRFAHRMIDAGADLVLGHGPHSIRGMELYRGKAIAYSLGNFVGYLGFSSSGHLKYSMILKVRLNAAGELLGLRVVPILLSPKVLPQFDPQGHSLALLNDLSRQDFGERAILLDPKGDWQPNPP